MTAPRFAAALSEHPVASHAIGEVAGEVLETLGGDAPDFVALFASPHFVGAMDDVTAAIAELLGPGVLFGGTAVGVVGGAREVEDVSGITLFAASCPDAQLTPVALDVEHGPGGLAVTGWPELRTDAATLLLFADPFSFPVEAFLARVREDHPHLQVIGGAASAARGPGGNRLLLDREVRTTGAVGVLLEGLPVRAVVSQGCRPVGAPLVVTRGDGTRIDELGGQPAIDRLQEAAATATEEDRALMRAGLQIGIVIDEHQVEFQRGDFLVRNVLGGDADSGAIAVRDEVGVGRTVQFHVRDAAAADEDLREMLTGEDAAAALLFTCNGRGIRFFGEADHDAGVVDQMLGPLPVAGAFCAGEVGPVGGRAYLHGFTASLALF